MAGKGVISQEYFTLRQLSAFSGLGVRFLREALKNPDRPLPHFRLNNKTIIVSRHEFAEWLEHFRVGSGEEIDRIVDEVMTELAKTKPGGRRPSGEKEIKLWK
ncbi:MAG: hypothetical protein JRI59_10240 [Deltaproteobacteria bacterium]|nr:hypothetical protein [Deltaproteobacteria bacterium]